MNVQWMKILMSITKFWEKRRENTSVLSNCRIRQQFDFVEMMTCLNFYYKHESFHRIDTDFQENIDIKMMLFET